MASERQGIEEGFGVAETLFNSLSESSSEHESQHMSAALDHSLEIESSSSSSLLYLSPYVPSSLPPLLSALKLLDIQQSDVVLDVGSGDGRVPVLVSKLYDCKTVGIESHLPLVEQSENLARKEGVSHLATFVPADVREPMGSLSAQHAKALGEVNKFYCFCYHDMLPYVTGILQNLKSLKVGVTNHYHFKDDDLASIDASAAEDHGDVRLYRFSS